MFLGMLKKAVFWLKALVASLWPFCGPPLDRGLSLLSKQACEARNSGMQFGNQDRTGARLYCKLAAAGPQGPAGRISGEAGMNEVVMMDGSQTQQILQTAIDHKVTAIMSYLSKGKWHVAKVLVAALDAATLSVQTTHSHNKQRPININIDQPVGISFKYEYGKFVFDATVIGLEPATDADAGGTVVLTMPEQIEVIQRRSYFRVEVPESLKVNVTLWHRKCGREVTERMAPPQVAETVGPKGPWRGDGGRYCRGRLVDISAGGAQIVLDSDSSSAPQFSKGQFIGMRFTPLPYERPLVFNAQIRNALPRADGDSIYLGLQIVGLEASPEGRQVLSRLVGVVERYYRMNQSGTKKNDSARAVTTA